MAEIHSSAIIADGAKIDDDVSVGPFCVIGAGVTLDAGVKIHAHVVVDGNTSIGAGTQIFPFSAIGLAPQDKKYAGEESQLLKSAKIMSFANMSR